MSTDAGYASAQQILDDLSAEGIQCDGEVETRDGVLYTTSARRCVIDGQLVEIALHRDKRNQDAYIDTIKGFGWGVLAGPLWTVGGLDPERIGRAQAIIGGSIR